MFLKTNISKELYHSEKFDQKLNQLLSELKMNGHISPEPYGNTKSTCGLDNKLLQLEPEFTDIFKPLITRYAKGYANLIGRKINDVLLVRAWVNEVHRGASAAVHTHNFPICDIVAIFYYKAPHNSSHFVVVHNKDTNYLSTINDFSMADKSYIRVASGDLILHDKLMPHGISEHLSDESRIAFVFDLKFIE